MRKVYVTQRAQDDLELVSFGTRTDSRTRMGQFDEIVSAALKEIGKNPTSGTRYVLGGLDKSEPPVLVFREAWTFHLKSVHPTAVHRLLYRIVNGNVEVARLLHDEMSVSNHLPIEWLLELVHIRAA